VFSLPVIVLGEDGRKPNVVIMFKDDQGTLDANCYGSKDLYTPGMVQRYKDVHKLGRAWPGITKGIKDAGVLDLEIYLVGHP